MKQTTRILTYLAVGLIVPIAIFIYERGYNRDAMLWIAFVTVLATAKQWVHETMSIAAVNDGPPANVSFSIFNKIEAE